MKSSPSLPEPRSFAGTALVIGALTALPFALMWTWLFASMQQQSFGEVLPIGLGAGLFFGVFFGLAMAFFLKGETVTLAIPNRKSFISRLNVATSQIGYFPETRNRDFLIYKPSLQAGLAAGRISVQLDEDQAVIVGPKMYVRKLLRRLADE